jgi:hypothetical protein
MSAYEWLIVPNNSSSEKRVPWLSATGDKCAGVLAVSGLDELYEAVDPPGWDLTA